MEASWSKVSVRSLLVLNFLICATTLALASWSVDEFAGQSVRRRLRESMTTMFLMIFSLIAGSMGVCSALAGLVHACFWRGDSLAAAVSSALISWAMTMVTFGIACKHINLGYQGASLKALEAFITILTVTQLIYLILLHLGIYSSKYGVGYRRHCNAYGMMEQDYPKNSAPVSGPDLGFRD